MLLREEKSQGRLQYAAFGVTGKGNKKVHVCLPVHSCKENQKENNPETPEIDGPIHMASCIVLTFRTMLCVLHTQKIN